MDLEQLRQAIRERDEMIRQCHEAMDQSNRQQAAVNAFLRGSLTVNDDWKNALASFFTEVKLGIEDLDSLIMNLGSDDDEAFIDVRDRIVAEIAELCERWGDICRKQEENGRRYRETLSAAALGEEDVASGVSP